MGVLVKRKILLFFQINMLLLGYERPKKMQKHYSIITGYYMEAGWNKSMSDIELIAHLTFWSTSVQFVIQV